MKCEIAETCIGMYLRNKQTQILANKLVYVHNPNYN